MPCLGQLSLSAAAGLRLTKAAPDLTVVWVEFEDASQVLHGLWKFLTCPQDMRNGVHRGGRPLIVPQGLLIRFYSTVGVAEQFCQ
jgi:hypothetical protein